MTLKTAIPNAYVLKGVISSEFLGNYIGIHQARPCTGEKPPATDRHRNDIRWMERYSDLSKCRSATGKAMKRTGIMVLLSSYSPSGNEA